MKSKLTSNKDRSALVELVDLLFVPSSFIRFAHHSIQAGDFQPKSDYIQSRTAQQFSKIAPYVQGACLDGIRLLGYSALGQTIINHYLT